MPWSEMPNTNYERTRFVSIMHRMATHYHDFDTPSLDRMLTKGNYKAYRWHSAGSEPEIIVLINPRDGKIPEISMLGWIPNGSTPEAACQTLINHIIEWVGESSTAIRCYMPRSMGDGTEPINHLHRAIIAEAEAEETIKIVKSIPTDEGRVVYIGKV